MSKQISYETKVGQVNPLIDATKSNAYGMTGGKLKTKPVVRIKELKAPMTARNCNSKIGMGLG